MITLYSFSITDYKGESVLFSTMKYASNRHAAVIAWQQVNQIPPACGIKIHKHVYKASDLARLLNEQLGYLGDYAFVDSLLIKGPILQ